MNRIPSRPTSPHPASSRQRSTFAPSTVISMIVLVVTLVGCGTNTAATATRAAELTVLSTALAPSPPPYTNPSSRPVYEQIAPPVGVPPTVKNLATATTNPTVANILNSQQATAQAYRQGGCDNIRAEYRRNAWPLDLTKPRYVLYAELQAMNGIDPGVVNRFTETARKVYREWLDECLG